MSKAVIEKMKRVLELEDYIIISGRILCSLISYYPLIIDSITPKNK